MSASSNRGGNQRRGGKGGPTRGRGKHRDAVRRSGGQRRPLQDPVREIAFDVLTAVDEDGAYANLLLPRLLRERRLEGRDAAFATELTFATLRLQGWYDTVIAWAAGRPTSDIDGPSLRILRLGTHQILNMNVPDYAAVSAMVALARSRIGPGSAKFANAVLRKITTRPDDAELLPDPEVDRIGYLAAANSHPRWMLPAFTDALAAAGRPGAELADLLRVNNSAPPVSLVARPGRIDRDILVERSGGRPGRWSPWAVGVRGDPGLLPEVRSGAAAVQDEGSQLMALALLRAEVLGEDRNWLDMCAGPGGKAADLAGLARQSGAELTAIESREHRAGLVRQALHWQDQDLGQVIVGDATSSGWEPGSASRVLLDAPCTGLGAIRRRPEARWRRDPDQLPELVGLQRRLLAAALEAVEPGGVVAYVTCSPHVSETDRVVDDALAEHPGVTELDARALLPEVPDTGAGKRVRLWPHLHNTDGMFLAVLRREIHAA